SAVTFSRDPSPSTNTPRDALLGVGKKYAASDLPHTTLSAISPCRVCWSADVKRSGSASSAPSNKGTAMHDELSIPRGSAGNWTTHFIGVTFSWSPTDNQVCRHCSAPCAFHRVARRGDSRGPAGEDAQITTA